MKRSSNNFEMYQQIWLYQKNKEMQWIESNKIIQNRNCNCKINVL